MTKSQENFKIPKGSRLSSEPDFPIDRLPGGLKALVLTCAESFGTAPEAWATAFISAIGAAVRKRIRLITGNYINYPQLWVLLIGRSGDGKSDPGKVAFGEIERIDAARYAKNKQDLQNWLPDKVGDEPFWEQILIGDTTPEALNGAFQKCLQGLTINRDELSGWFQDIGRYTNSGEVGHYLSMFDNKTFSINRKKEGAQLISEPYLSIYGTIQPSVLKDVLGKHHADKSGFAQRFLYVYPEFPKRRYKSSTPPDLSEYNQMIRHLVELCEDYTLTLSKDAEKAYENFYNEMEDHREHSDDFWSAVYSKAQIQVLRLALIIKIARDYKKMIALFDDQKHYVGHDDMICAAEMMRYYISCVAKFKDSEKEEGPKRSDVIKSVLKEVPGVSPTKLGEIFNVSKQYINKLKNQI